jgi:hypothetical protein
MKGGDLVKKKKKPNKKECRDCKNYNVGRKWQDDSCVWSNINPAERRNVCKHFKL